MDPSEDPGDRGAGEPGQPGADDDALRRLEQRLDRASDAAERLLAEAAGTAARAARSAAGAATEAAGRAAGAASGAAEDGGGGAAPAGAAIPPAGWQFPAADDGSAGGEVELLSQVLRSLRDLIPPDLQRRIAEALRELLLAIRALIDWYLERVDRTRSAPAKVQDIPIA